MALDKVVDSAALDAALTKIADSIRAKSGATGELTFPDGLTAAVEEIEAGGVELPELTNPATAADLLEGKELVDGDGNVVTGSMPTAVQATPVVTVSSLGRITAIATQSAGYVAAGTMSAAKQLTTQGSKVVTPGTRSHVAVASAKYTTGVVTVAGDANLVSENIVSGKSIFGVAGSAVVSFVDMEDGLLTKTLTTYSNDRITKLGYAAISHFDELTSLSLPNLTYVGQYAIERNAKLVEVNLPAVETIYWWGIQMNSALTKLKLPLVNYLYQYAFYNNSALETLILGNPSGVCTARGANILDGTPIASGTGYIYVPAALIDTYKSATNWSTYANQFRALEDYTVDGTTTGELDEDKISGG